MPLGVEWPTSPEDEYRSKPAWVELGEHLADALSGAACLTPAHKPVPKGEPMREVKGRQGVRVPSRRCCQGLGSWAAHDRRETSRDFGPARQHSEPFCGGGPAGRICEIPVRKRLCGEVAVIRRHLVTMRAREGMWRDTAQKLG